MKIRILLADDEPLILQGLTVLIDWESEGCKIVKTAANGKEALDYLKDNQVDLIIADIKMPIMTGLELLEKVRNENLSDAFFIILSGYTDFKYVQTALHYGCMEYILKPVKKEDMLDILRRVISQKFEIEKEAVEDERLRRNYLAQNLFLLLTGKTEDANLQYVQENMYFSSGIRDVHISLDGISSLEEMTDEEIKHEMKLMYENICLFLKDDKDKCIGELQGFVEEYELILLYSDYLAGKRSQTLYEFMESLLEAAQKNIKIPIVILVGKEAKDISHISYSYSSACMLRSFKGFSVEKSIYYYDELHIQQGNKVILCKKKLDDLLRAVEQNDSANINRSVDAWFQEMEQIGMEREIVSLNINYLLYQMVHLAVEQDETVNQEEVMLYISENVFDPRIARGSRAHLRRFAEEYAKYLVWLRKNVSRGVLLEIESEIKNRFAENLTLRELSKKYFINSAYLGQIFRKKYGMSFKNYLCNYRINEAAAMLLKTDKKIIQIADEVGYHDVDYFISKFIEQKGCTPAKYRKNGGI